MNRIIRFVIADILRSRIVLAYALLLLLLSLGLFALESRPEKVLLSLMSVVLIVVPLVALVFTTIHYYNSREFMELVLAQPVARNKVFWIEYLGLAFSLLLAFLVGVGLPVLLFDPGVRSLVLVGAGEMMTLVFVSIAFLIATSLRDKAMGIGLALLVWFFLALIFDGLLLLLLYSFSDYPLEKPLLVLSLANPIDIARILIVTRMDTAALMGHSGAVFRDFLATPLGWIASLGALLAWTVIPAWIALYIFKRKDL